MPPPTPRSTPWGVLDPVAALGRRPRCVCGKVWGATEAEARSLEREVARHKGDEEPVRFYRCRSDRRHWHWTRKGVTA